jgi:zinc protease
MTNDELMTNAPMPDDQRAGKVGLRHSLVIRHSSFVIAAFFIAAICLTNTPAAFAIAGVDQPPAPSTKHETKFPAAKETRLENGLRVIVVERPRLPLLAAEVVVRSGADVDPPNLAGAASFAANLLTKGTESMSAPQIASSIESLGGSIDSGAGWDMSGASVIVMSDKADPALQVLADVVRHPAFKQEEIDRLKNQLLDSLRVAMQQPSSLARFVTARAVFGAGAYGHAVNGTPESLQTISRDDLARLYQKYYQPRNAALVFAGALNLEKAKALAEKYFGDWRNGETSPDKSVASGSSTWKPRAIVVDLSDAGQAAVIAARPTIDRTSPDYYRALVTNAALGDGFASRLNREIRIKRGLSYGAGSAIDPRREPGPFYASAQTKNESAAEVASLIQTELQRLVKEPVKGEELKSRQAVLTGQYARELETNQGFVSQIAKLATYDLPLDALDKYIPSVDAVTAEDAAEFAKKYLAQPMSMVIIGQASAFIEPLKKTLPGAKVIPAKDLDLNRPDLTREKATTPEPASR